MFYVPEDSKTLPSKKAKTLYFINFHRGKKIVLPFWCYHVS